jgi:hypothetical protein
MIISLCNLIHSTISTSILFSFIGCLYPSFTNFSRTSLSTVYYIAGDEIGSNGDIRLSERISSSNTPTYKIGDKILFSIKKIEKNK